MKKSIKRGLMYGITANVILLSLTSLLADISSEMIQPILPLFITALGAGGLIVGILGGLSDSFASIFHMISGHLSDKTGKRKSFIIGGYSISAVAKLFMAAAKSWIAILILRPIERIGKGIREPPRDAILAETTPKSVHGKVFGFNKAFDRTGAIFGSILAIIFMTLGFVYNKIFLIAAIISFASVIPLIFVKEKKLKPKKIKLQLGMKNFPRDLKIFIWITTLFSLANFSYMFFILRANAASSAIAAVALYLISNIIFELLATPSGIIADRIGKKKVIIAGYLLLLLTNILFIFYNSFTALIIGFIIYGLSQALTSGNERALTADLAKRKNLGTAIGTSYMYVSIAALPASIIAGTLWQYVSPQSAFIYGAAVSFLALLAMLLIRIKE